MKRPISRFIGLPLAALCLFPAPAFPQNHSPSFPRDGATQLKEKEGVVAWDVTWKKGVSTGMRALAWDQVSFTLDEGAVKVTRPDGSSTIQHLRVGTARLESKGTVQAEEGVSDKLAREIVLQLKTPYAPGKWPTTAGVPGKFPRPGATKLFETDRLNIWDQQWPVGLHDGRHLHYLESIAVFIRGGKIRGFGDDGKPTPVSERKVGDVLFESAPIKAPHDEECVEGPIQIMWIEYK